MADFVLKEGAEAPSMSVQLIGADGSPQPLSGATVDFVVTIGETTITVPAIVTNPTTGEVRVDWPAGGFSPAGNYEAEFCVTLSDGKPDVFPSGAFAGDPDAFFLLCITRSNCP